MRYVASTGHWYAGVGGATRQFTVVENREAQDPIVRAFGLTEAEANICAFALNAIAEGKRLKSDSSSVTYSSETPYLGPTEGVQQ